MSNVEASGASRHRRSVVLAVAMLGLGVAAGCTAFVTYISRYSSFDALGGEIDQELDLQVTRVSPAERVEEVLALLTDLGADPIDFDRYQASLADEFVDPDLVVSAVTILDPVLLEQRGTSIDRQYVDGLPGEDFDPFEYGPDQVEWTTWSYEMDTGARLIVLIERDPDDPQWAGHCRVVGAEQWLREALWAATGVLPRDPGAPAPAEAELYGDAFELSGRRRFAAAPIPGR